MASKSTPNQPLQWTRPKRRATELGRSASRGRRMGKAKKPPLTHAACREGGVVSVWLGSLRSEADVDAYFRSGGFTRSFGFVIEPRDGPETDASPEPRPVEQLLDGFSWSRGFLTAAVAAAKAAGWDRANCAFVFLNFRYPPARGAGSGPMSFLGTFPFAERVRAEAEPGAAADGGA